MTSHSKPSGLNHLQDIRPYLYYHRRLRFHINYPAIYGSHFFRTAEYRETEIVCQDNNVYIVALKK
jgi:hypothetical protein